MLKKTDYSPLQDQTNKDTPTVIIVGAGFGGLAAGMILSSKGYKVTVLEKLNVTGGRGSSRVQKGHRFDLGPTILTVPKVFEELWARCGENFYDYVKTTKLDPYYNIVFQDKTTLRVSDSMEDFETQIKKISPKDLKGYRKFMDLSRRQYEFAFSKKGKMGRSSMHKFWNTLKVFPTFALLRADRSVYQSVAAYVTNPKLRFAMSFHPLFVGGDPFNVTSMWGLVNYLEHKFGVHYISGGAQAMADAMGKKICSEGGQLKLECTVEKILTSGDRAIGVQLNNGEKLFSDIVISNADVGHTYSNLLKEKIKKRWTERSLHKKNWSMSLFVWHFGTKKTSKMWKHVDHHTILVGPNYKKEVEDIFIKGNLPDEMSLYIHRPSVTDDSVAPKGDDTFYVLACVPHLGFSKSTDWELNKETYKSKVLSMLERKLMPGLAKTIKTEFIMTPIDFQNRYLSTYGSGFSIEPRMFQSAWFRPHNKSEELKNFYLVGAGTHPGPGMPGVMASAEILDEVIPAAKEFQSEIKVRYRD